MRHLLFVIGLAACHPIHPYTTLTAGDDGHPIAVGSTLQAFSGWAARCQTKGGFWSDSDPEYTDCHHKPVRLEVVCIGPCAVEQPRVEAPHTAWVTMRALAPGRVVVETRSTRLDKRKTQIKRFTFDVLPPQRLALACGAKYDTFETCGPHGVSAVKPVVRAQVFVDGEEQDRVTIRVNGEPREVGIGKAFSLSELYPDARATDDAIAPGTYLVELELAGMVERFQVTAR